MDNSLAADLNHTPLAALHQALGAKMVPFAGYEMPVHYPAGILAEHVHTRKAASLFDVSHMGQIILQGPGAIAALEALVCGDLAELSPGQMRYTLFTNDQGGIRDDLMVTRRPDDLFLVVNATCKKADFAHLTDHLPAPLTARLLEDRALLALQGPAAAVVLETLAPDSRALVFMEGAALSLDGAACFVTRSGYTGEDGFEISVAADKAAGLAERLLAFPDVAPAGLGARDTLRLEAGLCLYGHDIDETTTPVEAALAWAVGKRRRREGGYPGAAIIADQLAHGAPRKRVGLLPDGRAPAREGTLIVAPGEGEETTIGTVSSGGFGPTIGGPVAMGYVAAEFAAKGTRLDLMVRGRRHSAQIVPLPFVMPRYHRANMALQS